MTDCYSILLVDDEAEVRRAVRRDLHVAGYTIYEAESAAAALQIVRDQPHLDAIVSDYHMPGMDGLDLLQRVRMTRPSMLRILLTARADVAMAVRALNEGAVHRLLLKPWESIDLRGVLRLALHLIRQQNLAVPVAPADPVSLAETTLEVMTAAASAIDAIPLRVAARRGL